MGEIIGDRAVVLGASMAGLLAARVLAEHYHEVRVLDRDELTAGDERRRGTPQDRHIHALLPRGRQALEELLPGLTAQLVDAGAASGDLLGDARLRLSGHRLRRGHAGLTAVSATHGMLERHVRDRVRAHPRVTLGEPCDVVGLAATGDQGRVTGVRLLRRADGSAEETLEADLVVDATGRGSRTPVWLASLKYVPPSANRVAVDLAYATRTYRLPADALDGDWGSLQGPTPELPRGGALARVEGDRWMLSLFGLVGDHPPTDPEGFLTFARSLPGVDIHDAVRDGEALDDPVAYRFPADVWRRYDRLAQLPDGLAVVGDAVCAFNPIYGQGMTVAALEALALRDHLGRQGGLRPRPFSREVARIVAIPWEMAAGGDLAIPGVQGRRTGRIRAANAYVPRLHAAAARDERLAVAFVRAMALVDPPSTLLRPSVAARTLRHRRGARPTGPTRRRSFDLAAPGGETSPTGRSV